MFHWGNFDFTNYSFAREKLIECRKALKGIYHHNLEPERVPGERQHGSQDNPKTHCQTVPLRSRIDTNQVEKMKTSEMNALHRNSKYS